VRSSGRLGTRHFNVQKQRDLIAGHGASCLIIPAVMCPCLTLEKLPDPLCTSCGGSGRFPQDALQYTATLALLTNDPRDEDHPEGSWTFGETRCSLPPEVDLSEWDTVTILDIRDTFSEVLQRGIKDTVRFRQGVVLGIVLDRDQVYSPETDYTLTPPNTITWAGGAAPAAYSMYSVRYSAFPTYAVKHESPRLRLENRTQQAQVVTLKRLDQLDLARDFLTP
jgi:hypothetical protein